MKSKRFKIGRVFHFDAAHQLRHYKGKCENLHGHTYRLEVVVSGNISDNGMVIDFNKLKNLVDREILKELDHRNLNELFEQPTAENIAKWIFKRLGESIKSENLGINLFEVRLWEGDGKWVSISVNND
ncbi:MAG: 6-carboxytetrahydropterin synthase QueD [Candidatus Altiarchaeales archaeon]|nr:MAG: 6-carboxytetrahydropterin synthase QueD [Candidatus Altiarchaeales archaeon]RLI94220.1 MAG: 6-carboxytetrahydropterin synthase QueD [Candidatus Altiarchaeales archaeon]RLI95352.1 MAG: 6-carboxytetrahydropterin synthase QueD [Candidatus Altiarchaeales archaeon]HDO81955.1 6-carboxytetrahydropterin synthase QueD [Candidatus Altiarchaeales archaeon]HEX54604.1 6-carboxytetrahydropterin synthase QueD [Candidatus Altiarchaeales archaeon]